MDLLNQPAELRYGLSDFVIVKPGAFVVCAVTGEKIPLDSLKYWSEELQEAYANAEASTKRILEIEASKRET